jgi:TRAP-type mannitol/chloroaromatic compound transport system substrate-binding protein
MLHNFVNLEKWNSLPKQYQAVIQQASHVANTWMTAKYDAANPGALKRLIAGGAQLRPFSQPVMEACYKAANEVYLETSAANSEFKKVYDSLLPFRNDQYLWWQVAEYSFDTFMIRARARG